MQGERESLNLIHAAATVPTVMMGLVIVGPFGNFTVTAKRRVLHIPEYILRLYKCSSPQRLLLKSNNTPSTLYTLPALFTTS